MPHAPDVEIVRHLRRATADPHDLNRPAPVASVRVAAWAGLPKRSGMLLLLSCLRLPCLLLV